MEYRKTGHKSKEFGAGEDGKNFEELLGNRLPGRVAHKKLCVGYVWNDDVVRGAAQQRPLCEFGLPGNVDQIEYDTRSY
jgi:hypothetical protein